MTEDESVRMTRRLSGLPAAAQELLSGTNWESLQHAYGSGDDIPVSLCSLVDEDPEVRSEALAALDMGVLHQNSLYTVTAPATLSVAAILDHAVALAEHEGHFPWDDGPPRSLQAALLLWLGQVTESAAYGEGLVRDRTDWQWTPWHDETRREHDPDTARRTARVPGDTPRPVRRGRAVPLLSRSSRARGRARRRSAGSARPRARRPGAAGRHVAAGTAGRRERASVVRALGVWGGTDACDLLADSDPAVRVCAAL